MGKANSADSKLVRRKGSCTPNTAFGVHMAICTTWPESAGRASQPVHMQICHISTIGHPCFKQVHAQEPDRVMPLLPVSLERYAAFRHLSVAHTTATKLSAASTEHACRLRFPDRLASSCCPNLHSLSFQSVNCSRIHSRCRAHVGSAWIAKFPSLGEPSEGCGYCRLRWTFFTVASPNALHVQYALKAGLSRFAAMCSVTSNCLVTLKLC